MPSSPPLLSLRCPPQKRDAFKQLLIEKNLLPAEDEEEEEDEEVKEDVQTIKEYVDDFSRAAFGAETVTVTTTEGFGDSEDEGGPPKRVRVSEEAAAAAPVHAGPTKSKLKQPRKATTVATHKTKGRVKLKGHVAAQQRKAKHKK